ncbi:MAG: cytochrome c [Micavibrio sp.]|nr:cytochrome c [Micavibrio sp.]
MSLETNKIFAAILVAGITASFSGFLATQLVHEHELKENAYKIEGVAEAGGGPAVEAKPEPVLAMLAGADVAKGEQVAKVCATCHNFTKGGPNMIGPDLYGVVNRPKGAHEGFAYSDGMKKKGGNWTMSDLNHFLWKPKWFVEGTKMSFIGLKKPEDRAAVIAYLRTLSDSPAAMPGASDIAKEEAELKPAEPAKADDKAAAGKEGEKPADAKAAEPAKK